MTGKNTFFFIKVSGYHEDPEGFIHGGQGRTLTYSSHDTSSKTNDIQIIEELRLCVPRLSVNDIPILTKGTRKEIINYANELAEIHTKRND